MRWIALSTLVLIALSGPTAAADWPSWRGPMGNGVSPESGLPSSWSAREGVAWSAPLAGAGVSSPVIAGDRVFVTSQIGRGALKPGQHPLLARTDPEVAKAEKALSDGGGAGASAVFVVEAFDRVSGKKLWEHRTPAEGPLPLVHEKHNLATPSPVTDGERVYAWFGTGQVWRSRSTARCCGSATSAGRRAPSRSTGGTAARRRSTASCCTYSATTSRRRICSRSTRRAAKRDGRSIGRR